MKVLITGGCGFVGANLVARLQRDADIEVAVLDNESLGRREHLDVLTPTENPAVDLRRNTDVHG